MTTLRPVLKLGSVGNEVIMLQNLLISLQYLMGKADGVFGTHTYKAVKNFQVDHHLLPDGIVGPNTWIILEDTIENPTNIKNPTLMLGDKNSFIKELQLKLKILGYYNGSPDGMFEDDTNEAVKNFQSDNNLKVDGIVGPITWRTLNRSFAATDLPIPKTYTTHNPWYTRRKCCYYSKSIKGSWLLPRRYLRKL